MTAVLKVRYGLVLKTWKVEIETWKVEIETTYSVLYTKGRRETQLCIEPRNFVSFKLIPFGCSDYSGKLPWRTPPGVYGEDPH